MNSITLFKKVQFFSLLVVSVSTVSAMDGILSPEDIVEMQKESEGTGLTVLEKISSVLPSISLDDAKASLQNAGVEAAQWAQAGYKRAENQVQEIQNSDLYKKAGKTLKDGFNSAKDGIKKAVTKVRTITVDGTKKAVKSNVDAVKSVAQESAQSFKSWFNNRSYYSSDDVAIFGGTVLAVITLAGVTYVLYKNGTIKKIGNGISKYPALTTISAVTAGVVLTAVYLVATRNNQAVIVENK